MNSRTIYYLQGHATFSLCLITFQSYCPLFLMVVSVIKTESAGREWHARNMKRIRLNCYLNIYT